MVGGYEKQYFRTRWIVGCYLFGGFGAAYWKPFIWREKGKVGSGMALMRADLRRITWSSWWRREEGQRWEEIIEVGVSLQEEAGDKVGKRRLVRGSAIWAALRSTSRVQIEAAWKPRRGSIPRTGKNTYQNLLSHTWFPGKNIQVKAGRQSTWLVLRSQPPLQSASLRKVVYSLGATVSTFVPCTGHGATQAFFSHFGLMNTKRMVKLMACVLLLIKLKVKRTVDASGAREIF